MEFVSVIICTYNKTSRLLLTLTSYEKLYRNFYSNFEIIVCNDGGEDISLIVNPNNYSYPIRCYNLPHLGRAAARNYGVKNACGSIIMFNDDDILINPNCFLFHTQIHNNISNAVVVGKYRQIYLNENEIESKNIDEFNFYKYLNVSKNDMHEMYTKDKIFESKKWSRHWICGATGNMSLKNEVFKQSEGMDTHFQGWGYEDIEFSYRLFHMNLLFYCNIEHPNCLIDHARDKSTMISDIKRNILYFYNKHKQATDISLYWDFLRGSRTLKDFDSNMSEQTDCIYPGLLRTKLEDLESLSQNKSK